MEMMTAVVTKLTVDRKTEAFVVLFGSTARLAI
jgi:hypothetical protein